MQRGFRKSGTLVCVAVFGQPRRTGLVRRGLDDPLAQAQSCDAEETHDTKEHELARATRAVASASCRQGLDGSLHAGRSRPGAGVALATPALVVPPAAATVVAAAAIPAAAAVVSTITVVTAAAVTGQADAGADAFDFTLADTGAVACNRSDAQASAIALNLALPAEEVNIVCAEPDDEWLDVRTVT